MPFVPRGIRQSPMYRLATLGFHSGPAYRKSTYIFILCQILFCSTCFYFYYTWNGGLIPWFLRSQDKPDILTGVHVLHHFPQTDGDGSKLTWASAINSQALLEQAIKGDDMMIEGDILLRGQGTRDQQLVPVMAHPPDVNSDITFSQWILAIKHTGKGIKLDFKSIEAVELVLQTLKNVKEQMRGPLWLHGDILQGPNTDERPIDHQRFLRLCHEHFPESTISLGWKVGQSDVRTENAYTWSMVKSMHDVLERWRIRQPVTFTVRASYLAYSMPPLQWLMEMTGGTLTVFSGENDDVTTTDLLYVRRKLHKDQVYFDLPPQLTDKFNKIKDHEVTGETAGAGPRGAAAGPRAGQEGGYRAGQEGGYRAGQEGGYRAGQEGGYRAGQEGGYRAEDWVLARGEKGETIFLGSQSVVLQRGQLLSKAQYPMDHVTKLTIKSRAQFIPVVFPEGEDRVNDRDRFNLEVYLHVLQGARPSAISGIRGSVNPDGKISLGTKAVPGTDSEKTGTFKGPLECVEIMIEEEPGKAAFMKVDSLEECGSPSPVVMETVEVRLPLENLYLEGKYIAIRGVGITSFVAISKFTISHVAKSGHE